MKTKKFDQKYALQSKSRLLLREELERITVVNTCLNIDEMKSGLLIKKFSSKMSCLLFFCTILKTVIRFEKSFKPLN